MKPTLHPEVEQALARGAPVVALESTLLAHGIPPGRRAEAATRIEAAVRKHGAVPATIAIIGGVPHVGLDDAARARVIAGHARKASLRDLAIALAGTDDWATTVSTTMALAARVGISVFATGGIGGVHREVLETWDESADLGALAKHPVAVVCAGAKAVLDLPRTLERLETLGVPVLGYRCAELPAFYHAHSGLMLEHRVESAEHIARILRVRFQTLREGGVLIVQPPPAGFAQDAAAVDVLIAKALEEANRAGVRGAKITPFLLARLDRLSEGSVVDTNLALVEQNAALAADIAVELSKPA
ncbi:MAG: pseudouridine-5'-phosphate glycosidase [Myxococcota bacterium]